LHKTRLVAPFDGQVISSALDLGEFVQTGNEVAVLYDTAAVEVPIAIPLDELRWLSTLSPDTLRGAAYNAKQHQLSLPPATVRWRSEGHEFTWQGHITRWEGGLDEKTRTLTLVVEVPKPWEGFSPGQQPPLQPGMFCQVEIVAGQIPNAVIIPRTALYENNTVFLLREGTLAVRPVEVLRVLKDQVMIMAGLQRGDKLVISPLTAPIVGMKLRALEVEQPLPLTTTTVNRFDQKATGASGSEPKRGER
jgi:RND family efflux transporter MFP subunit